MAATSSVNRSGQMFLARFSQVADRAVATVLRTPAPAAYEPRPPAWTEKGRLDQVKREYVAYLRQLNPEHRAYEGLLEELRLRGAKDRVRAAKAALSPAASEADRAFAQQWVLAAESEVRTEYARTAAFKAFQSAPPVAGPAPRPAPPAAKPAPPKDRPKPGAPVWKEPGVFVWHTGAFPADHAIPKLQAAGIKWVAVQIADGMTVNTEVEEALRSGYIQKMRAAGIKVGFWGVNRLEPEPEARLAAEQVKKWGADFYIANAEIEYKYTAADGKPSAENFSRSRRWVAEFRKALPDLPAAVSSYGRADMADLDWNAWRKADFDYLPQTYENEFDIYDVREAARGAVKAGWALDRVHPTVGLWGGGQKRLVPAGEYMAELREAGTVGFSSYLAEQMSEADWAGLAEGIRRGGIAR
ncbi:MAG: hypothetical protein FJZ01_26475 [Candidatus Sericytochromatia bacterium]|nr:hypothetical protein [Candidatus Tanganyikabacteria bacterium]